MDKNRMTIKAAVRRFITVAGICLCLQNVAGVLQSSSDNGLDVLINGRTYSPDVYWLVTLKAGTAGSLFGDTMGPVSTFRYETVVKVNNREAKVIPGGTWSSNMGNSSYTVKIPLKDLGILDPKNCNTYYLEAFTRNYEGNSTVDTGYSLLYESISITTSLPPPPDLRDLTLEGIEVLKNHTSVKKSGFLVDRFFVAGKVAKAEVKVVNFDGRFYKFESATLIGEPQSVGTKKHELTGKFNGSDKITFESPLKAGKGLHGRYFWWVKAEFVSKVTGKKVTVYSNKVYEPVFFDKYGQDDTGNNNPNWFTYWKEDGACPSLKNDSKKILTWKGLEGWGLYGKKGDGTLEWSEKVYVHPIFAAEQHYADGPYEVTSPQQHYFGGPHIWGIYTAEEVLTHEFDHAVRQDSYNGWLKLRGDLVSIWVDSDRYKPTKEWKTTTQVMKNGQMKVEERKIEYCDYLVDKQEQQSKYQLDFTTCDTYNIAAAKNVPEYTAYGDDEFLAMMAANKATDEKRAVLGNDWAFPGEQSCVPNRVVSAREFVGWPQVQRSRLAQLKEWMKTLDEQQSQTKLMTSTTGAASPSIVVNGMAKELVHDETTALVSAVNYRFDLTVGGLHELRLVGVMTDLNSNVVAVADTAVSNGNVSAELRFLGTDVYASGRNGPFRLENVKLVAFDGNDFSELATLSEFKDARIDLQREDFARKEAYLLDVVRETVTTDGIVVSVSAEINVAGNYEIFATLAGTNGMAVASCSMTTNCVHGTNCINVVFAAGEILQAGIDGPYVIDNIALLKNGERVDARLDFYTLRKMYQARAFDFEESGAFDSDAFMEQFDDYVPTPELPSPERFWVFFNPNGGTVAETTREVIGGEKIGALPLPILEGDEFLGWYTELEGGECVSETTTITNHVLYHAHWKNGGVPGPVPEPEQDEGTVSFNEAEIGVKEGKSAVVSVTGGSTNAATSVKVFLTYRTATASDLNLGSTKYPITLKWAKGEVGEKKFSIPTKNDSAYEDDETFVLQLASPSGLALGDVRTCAVTITDDDAGVSLNEGIMNGSVKVKTNGAGKWTVKRGWERWEDEDASGFYHVETPALKKGKSSTLQISGVSGPGSIEVVFRFTGATNEAVSSTLKLYAGNKLMHTYRHVDIGNTWYRYTVDDYGYGSHTYRYVFTQGSDPNCHVELSEVFWNSWWRHTPHYVSAYSSDSNAGKVTGSGWYKPGAKAKLVARANPGWAFAGWYKFVEGEAGPEYVLWNKNATVTYTANDDLDVWAEFDRKPYVCGLADTPAGGQVTGSAYLAPGGKVTLKAVAAANYHFGGWYASDASGARIPDAIVGENLSLVVTNAAADVTYWARFILNAKVSTTYNTKLGTVSGNGRYAPGKTATLTATPKKGYAFTGWYDADGNLLSTSATYKYKMTADGASFTASFKKESALVKPTLLWGDFVVGAAAGDSGSSRATNLTVGVSYSAKLSVEGESAVAITKVTGLPKGLTYKGGKVTGVPTTVKVVTAKVTVALKSNAKKTWTYNVKLNVAALPAWAAGTFKGTLYDGSDESVASPKGTVTLTVGKTGKISGKFVDLKNKAYSFTAPSFKTFEDGVLLTAAIMKYGTKSVSLEIAVGSEQNDAGETVGFAEAGSDAAPFSGQAAVLVK